MLSECITQIKAKFETAKRIDKARRQNILVNYLFIVSYLLRSSIVLIQSQSTLSKTDTVRTKISVRLIEVSVL